MTTTGTLIAVVRTFMLVHPPVAKLSDLLGETYARVGPGRVLAARAAAQRGKGGAGPANSGVAVTCLAGGVRF